MNLANVVRLPMAFMLTACVAAAQTPPTFPGLTIELEDSITVADDGNPKTMAKMYEVKILWNRQTYDTMFPIVKATFRQRGSQADNMNGKGRVSGERAI